MVSGSRDWSVTAALHVLQQAGRGYLFAEIVGGVSGQSEVAIDERDKGQSLSQSVELRLL